MHIAFSAIFGLIASLCLAATIATAAPPAKEAENRYVAARDAAIEKISAIYDTGNADEAARKAEDAASADLAAQMRAILNEAARAGLWSARLHIDTFNKGDEGLRHARRAALRSPAREERRKGRPGSAPIGKYVAPKAQSSSRRKRCSSDGCARTRRGGARTIKNVPQQIGAALKDESFYTQAVSSGSAVGEVSIRCRSQSPAGATFVHGMLAGRTQSDIPDAADTVLRLCASPMARCTSPTDRSIPRCRSRPASPSGRLRQKAEQAEDDLRSRRSTEGYDKLGTCARRRDEYKRCFTQNAPSSSPLPKQRGRRRNCCRRRWEDSSGVS
jgi:hypothetical protein